MNCVNMGSTEHIVFIYKKNLNYLKISVNPMEDESKKLLKLYAWIPMYNTHGKRTDDSIYISIKKYGYTIVICHHMPFL